MTKRRTSPSDLVSSSGTATNRKWLDSLNKVDLKYVRAVANSLAALPEASPAIVARRLKKELGANVAEATIVRALKGIADAKN